MTVFIKDRNSTPGRGSSCVTFRIQGPRGRERRRSDEATLVPDEWRCAVPGGPARSGNGPRHQESVAGHIWITVENARTPARHWRQPRAVCRGSLSEAALRARNKGRAKSWTFRSVADAKQSETRSSPVESCYEQPPAWLMAVCTWYRCGTPSSEIGRDLADVAILFHGFLRRALSTARAPNVYLLNEGLLEYTQQIATHESARTTKLYAYRG